MKFIITILCALPLIFIYKFSYSESYHHQNTEYILKKSNSKSDGLFNYGKLNIVINDKDLKILNSERMTASETNILVSRKKVGANVSCGGFSSKAQINLKGFGSDHWNEGERFSLKILLSQKLPCFKLTEFSIQKPASRQYPADLLYQYVRKQFGLLPVNNGLVSIAINDADWGDMIVEDALGTDYYFTSEIPESPIIRLEGDLRSYALEQKYHIKSQLDNGFDNWRVINGRHSKPYKSDAFKSAVSELMSFSGAADVIDINAFSMELALAEAYGTYHPLINGNLRLYFNPLIGKFQPIATDANPIKNFDPQPSYLYLEFKKSQIWKNVLDNPLFIASYLNSRKVIASNICNYYKVAHQKLLEDYEISNDPDSECLMLEKNINKNFSQVHSNISKNKIIKGDQFPLQDYSPVIEPWFNPFSAKFYKQSIELKNLSYANIKLENISSGAQSLSLKNELMPYGKENDTIYLEIPFELNLDDKLVLNYYIGKKKASITLKVFLYDFSKNLPNSSVSQNTLFLENSSIKLDTPQIFANHVTVERGVTFNLCKECYIYFANGVTINGSPDYPVKIAGLNDDFQGVLVNSFKRKSEIRNLIVGPMSGLNNSSYFTDSCVTLYGGDYSINSLSISGCKAEDAIHAFKAQLSVTNLNISNTYSDALDLDYGALSIKDSSFLNIKGDAIDISKSSLDISNSIFKMVSDKSLSIGEDSKASIRSVEIANSNAGIVCKDSSVCKVESAAFIEKVQYNYLAYVKKSYFHGATMSITDSNNIAVKYLCDDLSSINYNNLPLPKNVTKKEIKDLYKAGFMVK